MGNPVNLKERFGGANLKESKRERFKRLAEARTNKIISMIHLLGNLSNRSVYEYTDKEVQLIFDTLTAEMNRASVRFSPKAAQEGEFRLEA